MTKFKEQELGPSDDQASTQDGLGRLYRKPRHSHSMASSGHRRSLANASSSMDTAVVHHDVVVDKDVGTVL